MQRLYCLLFTLLILGCTSTAPPESTVRMIVSRDLGETVLLDTEVTSSGSTIGFLNLVSEVETTYGGKFVDSIAGIRTEPEHAWFYYVNGELMGVGAAAYIPKNGDVIQWDYHYHSENPFEPAALNPPSQEGK